jgi:hypothetical protein
MIIIQETQFKKTGFSIIKNSYILSNLYNIYNIAICFQDLRNDNERLSLPTIKIPPTPLFKRSLRKSLF